MVTLTLVIYMNKKSWIIITVVVAFILGIGTFLYLKNTSSSSNKSNYEANKTSTDTSSNNQTEETPIDENQDKENEENTSSPPEEKQESNETQNTSYTSEEQIATFSTKIYSKDSARQNNISITCKTLNGTIVKNGATFSFCSTVGPSSTSKGYQKADIFDKNGNKKKGLGGRKLPN